MSVNATVDQIFKGRKIAVNLIQTFVTGARSPEDLDNNMFLLQIAACHILATVAFNSEVSTKEDGQKIINQFSLNILNEIKVLREDFNNGHVTHVSVDDSGEIH